MRLVALSWARIGWAKYQNGENLPALRFLTAAWLLSDSGAVADRMAQVLEKQGQTAKAQHMYALAAAAGGNAEDVKESRARWAKLTGDPAITEKDTSQAREDLAQSHIVKLASITNKAVSARFNLVFDGSPRPERIEFIDGDETLRSAAEQLRDKDFPVRFPDASSVKIIRQALLRCGASGCSIELPPIEK
jgi:hypothetical protein